LYSERGGNHPALFSSHSRARQITWRVRIIKEDAPEMWADIFLNEQRKDTINIIWKDAIRQSNLIYFYLRDNSLPIHEVEEKYFKYADTLPGELIK